MFVDSAKASCGIVLENIHTTGFENEAQVMNAEYASYLLRCTETFDIAFLDPPYASGLLSQALTLLAPQIDLGGTVICESDRDKAPDGVGGLWLRKIYRYGRVCIWLYRKENRTESPEGGDRL